MKINKRITVLLVSMAALGLMTTMTGCSGSSGDEADLTYEGVMTAQNFSTLQYAFEVIGVGPVYFVPSARTGELGDVTDSTSVYGYLYTPTSTGISDPIDVLFEYTTSGNVTPDGAPTTGMLVMDFDGYEGQGDDALITALGFREIGKSLRALTLVFNFVSGTVDIYGDGAGGLVTHPSEDGTQDTDTEEAIYAKTFFITRADSL